MLRLKKKTLYWNFQKRHLFCTLNDGIFWIEKIMRLYKKKTFILILSIKNLILPLKKYIK